MRVLELKPKSSPRAITRRCTGCRTLFEFFPGEGRFDAGNRTLTIACPGCGEDVAGPIVNRHPESV